jgi:hypothetical protein
MGSEESLFARVVDSDVALGAMAMRSRIYQN